MKTHATPLRLLVAHCFLVVASARLPAGEAPVAGFAVQPRDNIVVFGDSITANGAYSQYIQDLVDEAHPDWLVRVYARGIHGETARGAIGRIEADVLPQNPEWIVLNFGINDLNQFTTDEFLLHYENLINRLLTDTRARLTVASPLYPDRDSENPKLNAFVAGLRDLADRYHLTYAPVYEETRRLRTAIPEGVRYAVDGSHPNDVGHWIMAQTILGALDFEFPRRLQTAEIPARRTVADRSDELAGVRFKLDLPMPVEVVLTAPPPPAALAAKRSITIDGRLDDWMDVDSTSLHIGSPQQRSWSVVSWPRDHHNARARFAWDEGALYFSIEVDDSWLRGGTDPESVERDCLELELDARTLAERETAPYVKLSRKQPHVAQYLLAPSVDRNGTATAAVGLGDKTMAEGVMVASRVTPRGYQLEARIPVERFSAGRFAPGDAFPVDITTINLDRGEFYRHATSFRWTGSTLSAFHTREYGLLTLVD